MRGLEVLETAAFPMKRINFEIPMNECLLLLAMLSPLHGSEKKKLLGWYKANIYLRNLLLLGAK